MASITDCVVEGLKYPFNDIKKVFGIGVLFVVFELLTSSFTIKTVEIFRDIINKNGGHLLGLKASQLPNGDIFMATGLIILAFIVFLFIMGYQYNVVKFSIDKKDDLPGFGNILDIFIKGIKYFIVSLVYALPAMIVMSLGLMFTGNTSILLTIMSISMVLGIIAYFFLIMALNNMVAHDSLKKAFDFREITDNISNLGWGKYIGIVIFTIIVYMIINVAVGLLMSFVTALFAIAVNQAFYISIFLEIIEGLFVASYCTVFFNRVCGSIYRESIK